MKNTILILAICLIATYPRATANVHELAAKTEQSVNNIPLEEKLLTAIPKEYKEPGWYEYPPDLYGRRYWDFVFKVRFERYGGGWEVTLSPDYSKVAYRAKAGGKVFVVINGKKGSDFDDVRYLTFSRDGSKLAYAAQLKNRWFIVTGDEKGPEFDKVGPPVFSPDGSRLAYAAELTEKEFLVIDGQKGEEFEDVSSPIFSPDGKMLAFVARTIGSKKTALFIGDKKVAEHPIITDVTFSPSGQIAYAAGERGHMFMIVGDKQGPEFHVVFAPTFSSNGNQVAYLAINTGNFETKPFVVSGDYRGTEYSFVSPPVFATDGSKLVYIVAKVSWLRGGSKGLLHLGGTIEESKCIAWDNFEVIFLTGVESWRKTFTASPDGSKVACKVLPDADRKFLPKFNKWQIAVGKQLGPEVDDVGLPVFTSDGSAVGYWARKDKEIWWKVMTVK